MNTDLLLGFLYCFGIGIAVGVLLAGLSWFGRGWTDKQIERMCEK